MKKQEDMRPMHDTMMPDVEKAYEILDAGYRYHYGLMYDKLKSTPHLFQKCIEDQYGKKYFIFCWFYDYNHWTNVPTTHDIQFEAQFKDHEGDALMNVQLFTDSIEEAEVRFAKMWENDEDVGYYEKWEDG